MPGTDDAYDSFVLALVSVSRSMGKIGSSVVRCRWESALRGVNVNLGRGVWWDGDRMLRLDGESQSRVRLCLLQGVDCRLELVMYVPQSVSLLS